MMDKHFYDILDMANAEIKSVAKNEKFKTADEIKAVGSLVEMVKDIYKIEEMCEEDYDEGDSSYRGGSRGGNRGNSYRYPDMGYDDGMSYARGRRNARRDSMGRYSRNDGYSRHDGKEEYIDNLREAMETAPTEEARQSIKRMIDNIERA